MTATDAPERTSDAGTSSASTRRGDRVFAGIARLAAFTILAALVAVFVFLAVKGWSGFTAAAAVYAPFTSFVTYIWPLVVSTLLASAIAVIVAVPFAIGIALFISHYAPRRLASALAYLIDLLAAVPSVVFGLWGGRYLAALPPAVPGLAPRALRLAPVLRPRAADAQRALPLHRRHRAGDHDPADHHRDHPRGLRSRRRACTRRRHSPSARRAGR